MIRVCPRCGSKNRVPAAKLGQSPICGRCKTPLGPLARPVSIASEAEFDELVGESPLPVVVDFWAAWCGPCRVVAPELEKLAKDRAGDVVVAKVDTQALPGLAARFGIQSLPTFVRFDGGTQSKQAMGAMPANRISTALGL